MASESLTIYEVRALRFLAAGSGQGGFTSGRIAKEIGWGADRSMMAVARGQVLVPMMKKGWLAPLDDQKPVIFCITDAGRAALARHDAEQTDVR